MRSAETNNALQKGVSQMHKGRVSWKSAHHLEGPNSADPDLECAVDTFNIIKVNAFPPAAASRLAPEQKELLSHADSVGVGVATDIGTQTSKGDTADDSLVRLASTVTPGIVVVETTRVMMSVKRTMLS